MDAKYITPAVTAFDHEGHVDMEANKRIYQWLIEGGMDGILILGSIGEFFAIPMEEKKRMIQEALDYVDHRVTVYVGTGGTVFEECVELSRFALDRGADGVMVISPYYFNLPDSSILNFYDTLAGQLDGPVLLYNFPARTGYDLTPEVVLELARRRKNIVGIKDTVDVMGHTRELIQTVKREYPEFLVYSGFDEFFSHNVISGGNGCIAGLSNFAPETASRLAQAARKEDFRLLREYQVKIDRLMAVYAVAEQFVPIIKKAMVLRGIGMTGTCARPMLEASEEETEKLLNLLKKEGLVL